MPIVSFVLAPHATSDNFSLFAYLTISAASESVPGQTAMDGLEPSTSYFARPDGSSLTFGGPTISAKRDRCVSAGMLMRDRCQKLEEAERGFLRSLLWL